MGRSVREPASGLFYSDDLAAVHKTTEQEAVGGSWVSKTYSLLFKTDTSESSALLRLSS